MSKPNSKKESFLKNFQIYSVESVSEKFTDVLGFNFQFFDNNQPCGQDFRDWTHEQLYKLFDKLKEYSKFPVKHWLSQRIGTRDSRVLALYGDFPSPSDFTHPKHVPIDVKWGRFRLESDCRLVGFMIDEIHSKGQPIKPNIFYVVFLDANHRFYKTEH